MRHIKGLDELRTLVGQQIGQSDWVPVDQATIQAFADVTRDHYAIHVDPKQAAASTFSTTIAHGYYTLSLIGGLMQEIFTVDDCTVLNYGISKARFPQAVPVGSRLRLSIGLTDLVHSGLYQADAHYHCTIGIDGQDKPACAADTL